MNNQLTERLEKISLLEDLGYGEDLIESILEADEKRNTTVFGTFDSAKDAIRAAEEAASGKKADKADKAGK